MHLLDINVLLALVDPLHVHHDRTRSWFLSDQFEGWATCPLTENGMLRILSQPTYPGMPRSADQARQILETLVAAPGHQFWPDDLTLRNHSIFPDLGGPKLLTDLYLLGLAANRQGKLVTLDERINPDSVIGGNEAYLLIPD